MRGLAIGESAPCTFFADIEARISSTYKAVAKRRLRIETEVAELLDFGQLSRRLDYEAITHYVDCETAVYDFAMRPRRPESHHPQKSSPSNAFIPVLFLSSDRADLSDSLLLCFGAPEAVKRGDYPQILGRSGLETCLALAKLNTGAQKAHR